MENILGIVLTKYLYAAMLSDDPQPRAYLQRYAVSLFLFPRHKSVQIVRCHANQTHPYGAGG